MKWFAILMLFLPLVIMLGVTQNPDFEGLWIYYLPAIFFAWALLTNKLD